MLGKMIAVVKKSAVCYSMWKVQDLFVSLHFSEMRLTRNLNVGVDW